MAASIRIAFFFGALLALAGLAQAASITQHSIQIDVDAQGYGHVTEKFLYVFNTERELVQFRQQAQSLGADLDAWRSFDQNIYPYIGSILPGSGRIGYEEAEGDRQVKLEYQTKDPLFLKNETTRQTVFSIDSRAFEAFRQGSVYVIPSNTKIIFNLPKQAVLNGQTLAPAIEDPVALQQAETEKKIFWSGHLTISGNLVMEYSIEKQIAPPVSLSKILRDSLSSNEAPFVAAVLLVLLGMAYFKRKSIQKKFENYLVENTQLEHAKENEPIEIEE